MKRPIGTTVAATVLMVTGVFQVLVGLDGWGELTPDEIALIGAPKPAEKNARRLRDRAIAYAWAADRLEPGTRRVRRAAQRLLAARSGMA